MVANGFRQSAFMKWTRFLWRKIQVSFCPSGRKSSRPRRRSPFTALEVMALGRVHLESALVLNCLPGRSCLGVGVFDLQRDDCPMAYVYLRHLRLAYVRFGATCFRRLAITACLSSYERDRRRKIAQ